MTPRRALWPEPLMSPFAPRSSTSLNEHAYFQTPPANLAELYEQRERRKISTPQKRPATFLDTDSDPDLPSVSRILGKKKKNQAQEIKTVSTRQSETPLRQKVGDPATQTADGSKDRGTRTGESEEDEETIDGDCDEWPIKGILKSRGMLDGTLEYLVQWEDTWIVESMVSREAITNFEEREARVEREAQRRTKAFPKRR